uniref:CoA_binding domain-containing protein n=1 Tax=Steinernema glaseri TaxID=37863 RepID=A0A1I7Y3I9_9BILA
MPIIPSNHAKLLTEFAKSKRLVAVVVKGRRDFFFNLEGLAERRPEDVGLLAFVPKESNLNGTVKLFDAIIPYDVGKPVVSIVEPFEEAQKESFPGMYDFTKKIIETFKPPHPQVFCFQGFQVSSIQREAMELNTPLANAKKG